MEKIYEAAYNHMTEESSFATISLHRTKEGTEKAISEHKTKMESDWRKDYPNPEEEPYPFGTFEAWRVFESELLD